MILYAVSMNIQRTRTITAVDEVAERADLMWTSILSVLGHSVPCSKGTSSCHQLTFQFFATGSRTGNPLGSQPGQLKAYTDSLQTLSPYWICLWTEIISGMHKNDCHEAVGRWIIERLYCGIQTKTSNRMGQVIAAGWGVYLQIHSAH